MVSPCSTGPGGRSQPALLVHQVSFYAWLAAVVVYVVPHFLQAVHLARRDWVLAALLAAGASVYLQHVPLP